MFAWESYGMISMNFEVNNRGIFRRSSTITTMG
jgi:hypothetical protein